MASRFFCVFCILLILLVSSPFTLGDIYLDNFRGSNNRLDEASNNRNNANRLFNSQNNNRGGHNVGSLYYYAGSNIMLEWTAQHASGNPITHNEFIVQYMCDKHVKGIRDGTTTTTIPDDAEESRRIEYGQHEDYHYYQRCRERDRNFNLYTADQLNNNQRDARYTRQNPNRQRYGFECPEERDYYPYWHPSPWVDIAVMTSNMSRCEYYWRESQNVIGKNYCSIAKYNNEKECKAEGGTWEISEPHGHDSPVCLPAPYSRDNHLGNTVGGYPMHINVTFPTSLEGENCVLRVRYNISTGDFDGWNVDARHNTNGQHPEGVTPDPLVVANYPDGSGEIKHTGNPNVDIGIGVELQLNINTNQQFRTFQDRSHTFEIRKPPSDIDPKRIHNLNVRGKRGNIVQVYPSKEYDFTPNVLVINKGDYVHIQWTGSNTNPNGNDGEGRQGTDRNNLVQIPDLGSNFPLHIDNVTMFEDRDLIRRLALLDHPQFGGETSTLDDAGTYFDAGLIQFNKPGTYHYASTRNNNFSNRSQKGTIIVVDDKGSLSGGAIAGIVIGSIVGVGAVVGVAVAGVLFVTFHEPTRKKLFRV